MTTPFPLPTDSEMNKEVLARLESLPKINIYRLLARFPRIFDAWIDMVQGIYALKFDMRLREIAIVRQAYRAKSVYELHQHKFIALANKVSQKEIDIITSESTVTSLGEKENLVCKAADEIEAAFLADATREKLIQFFGKESALELIIILSFYCAIARFLNAAQVPIESDNPLAGKGNPLSSIITNGSRK